MYTEVCDALRTLLVTKTKKNKLLTHADDASNKFAYSRYNMIVPHKNIKFFHVNDYNLALDFGALFTCKSSKSNNGRAKILQSG